MTGLERLEEKLEMPRKLEKELEIKGDDGIVYSYWGCIGYISMKDGAIYGTATLNRSDYRIGQKKKTVLVKTPFPHFEPRWEQTKEFEGTVWRLSEDDLLLNKDGEPVKGKGSYRERLRELAFSSGIVIKDELLDTIFNPLDEQLAKIYKQYVAKRDSK